MTDSIPRGPATIGILIGIFIAAIEGTVVGTAMPSVVSSLGGVDLFFLPIAIYMLTGTVTVPVFGRLSDIYGRRAFHLVGLLLFMIGSGLCGMARSMEALIVFRAIQGVGAGALMPLSFTMIADLYPLEQRAKMQGAISGVWGIASVIGPPAGGLITTHLGWPWVFYVNIPFGLVSLAIIQSVWKDGPRPARTSRLDIPGAMLLMLASGTLMAAFGMARMGWTATPVLGLFGAFGLLIALLIFVERRAADPFLSYDLFRSRIFWAGTLCGSMAVVCMFGVISYLPLHLQAIGGAEPSGAGMVLTPMMMGWVTVSFCSVILLRKFSYRGIAITGTLFLIVAYALLTRLGVQSSWTQAGLAVTFLGTGLGCLIAPLLIAAQNSVGRHKLGAATSLTQFSRSMMGVVGVGIMGAVMSSVLARLAPGQVDAVVNPILRSGLSNDAKLMLRGAMAESLRPVFLIGLGAAILAFLSALLLPPGRAKDLAVGPAGHTPGSPPG